MIVRSEGDDVLVTTMQDMVRVKLPAGQVDVHSTAILTKNDDGSYYANVIEAFAVVYNDQGIP